jgi:cytochrome P450
MALPPGPRAPALVQTLRFARDPVGFFDRLHLRYGPAVHARFAGYGDVVWLTEPAAVRSQFADPDRLHAGKAANVLEPVLGPNSVLTLDGAEHLRQRKLLLPPFHGESVKRYTDIIRDAAEAELDRWPRDRPFALRDRMQALTLEVILHAVFGVTDASRRLEYARRIRRLGAMANFMVLPEAVRRDIGRFSIGGVLARRLSELDELIFADIRTRRAEAAEAGADVLSLLLTARDDNGQPMTSRELRDELVSLLFAGHETTATGLAWAFDLLLHRPDALERAVEEAHAEAHGYSDAIVKETLRLRPVVFATGRIVQEPVEVGGYQLPAGVRLWAPIVLLGRDARFFPDPDAFRPERFLDDSPAPYTWIPFGGGVRRCIGAAFASQEMRVVLQTILARASLQPVRSNLERGRLHGVTIVPAHGTEVRLTARRRRTVRLQPDRSEAKQRATTS